MATIKAGELEHRLRRTTFEITLGGPARLTGDGPADAEKTRAWSVEAARGGFANIIIAELELPACVDGWRLGTVVDEHAEGRELSLSAAVVDEMTAARLTATAGEVGQILIWQLGPDETPDVLFARLAGEIETRPKTGKELAHPPPLGCILAAGNRQRRDVLDLAVAAIGQRCPELLGWRVLPGDGRGRNPAICFSVAREEEPVQIEEEAWELINAEGSQRGAIVTVRHRRRDGGYGKAGEVLAELIDTGVPRHDLFDAGGPIPGAPTWVQYAGRTWLAARIRVRIGSADRDQNGTEERILGIELLLRERRAFEPIHMYTGVQLDGVVEAWHDDGASLLVKPAKESGWTLTGPAPSLDEKLAVRCLTPAWAAEERGGLYLRPAPGDPRRLLALQAQAPIALGAIMRRNDEAEEDQVDLRVKGTRLELEVEGGALRAHEGNFEIAAETLIGIEGTVEVQGKVDVS